MGDRSWSVDEANAALDRVTVLVQRAQRAVAALRNRAERGRVASNGNGHAPRDDAEPRLQRALDELGADGIVLRDVDQGLIDFPAHTPDGRPYWLCWVVGEPAVAWWHWPEDGFAGRTPIDDPPT